MKITDDYIKLVKNEKGYQIQIEMPDVSRNYVHSQEFNLYDAIKYRDDLLDIELDKESILINEDGTYYRLYIPIMVGNNTDVEAIFHSRKLNLNDALFERMQLSNK